MRAQSLEDIEKELEEYQRHALTLSLPDLEPHPERLRVSGFPFCALKTVFSKLQGCYIPDDDDEAQDAKSTFGKDYYCSVGTATHTVLQRYMASGGRILGDWKCYRCGATRQACFKKRCKKCGAEMEYEEFSVKAFKHLSGHLDGVWQAKDGRYYVIDYKTCSVRALAMHKKEGTLPYVKNQVQIMTYCALIEKTLGIKISGWLLIYVARDNPMMHFKVVGGMITPEEKSRLYEMARKYDRHYEALLGCKEWRTVKMFIREKPCRDYDYYSEYFKGFKGCPLESVCFTKHLKSTVKDAWAAFGEEFIAAQSGETVNT